MYGNPYFNQPHRYPSVDNFSQQIPNQQFIAPIQQPTNQVGLLGKSVDSIEVVKAMDIPLDGSVSYFPLTDGSAIVTKKLQSDGTSKTVVYKPVVEKDKKESSPFVTFYDLENFMGDFEIADLENLKSDIREIKKQLKEIKTSKKQGGLKNE